MADKVFGQDFTDETTPTSSSTISVNNGSALVDVALSNLHKALTAATIAQAGVVELATGAETADGIVSNVAVTPAGLSTRTATETRTGLAELATSAEVQTGSDTERIVTPAGLASLTSTESRRGLVELATSAETITGSDTERAVHPSGLASLTSTDTRRGLVELATNAEVATGTDTARAVTPAGAAAAFAPIAKGVTNGDSHNHVGGDGEVLYQTTVLGTFLAATVPASTTYYSNPFKTALNATGNTIAWPVSGALSNLLIRTPGGQPASGSLVITLTVNTIATALSVTVPAGQVAAVTVEDITNVVNINAGDLLQWTVQNNATATSCSLTFITMKLKSPTT